MQFSTKIDGFEQKDSQGFENSYNSYEQYPLEKFFIFTIYQNYTLALISLDRKQKYKGVLFTEKLSSSHSSFYFLMSVLFSPMFSSLYFFIPLPCSYPAFPPSLHILCSSPFLHATKFSSRPVRCSRRGDGQTLLPQMSRRLHPKILEAPPHGWRILRHRFPPHVLHGPSRIPP